MHVITSARQTKTYKKAREVELMFDRRTTYIYALFNHIGCIFDYISRLEVVGAVFQMNREYL